MKHKGILMAGVAALTACVIILMAAYAMAASAGKCAAGGSDDCYSMTFGTLTSATNSTSYCTGAYVVFGSMNLLVYNGGSVSNTMVYSIQSTADGTGNTGWANVSSVTGSPNIIKDTTNADHNMVDIEKVSGVCFRVHGIANISTTSTLIVNGAVMVK